MRKRTTGDGGSSDRGGERDRSTGMRPPSERRGTGLSESGLFNRPTGGRTDNSGWGRMSQRREDTSESRGHRPPRPSPHKSTGRSSHNLFQDRSLGGDSIPKIVIIAIVAIVVICILAFLYVNGASILAGIRNVTSIFATSLVIAAVVWLLLMAFLNKFFPGKLKMIAFVAIWVMAIVGFIMPDVGSALVSLGVMLAIIVFVFYRLIH